MDFDEDFDPNPESFDKFVNRSFGELSKSIRKDSRSVRNRIQSIIQDSKYVESVSSAYGLPLIANERCGRWYIPPEKIRESVYFKSTDGHTGQWGFSTRRLNIHILDVIIESGGIVIVDSTRRGKRMPDALSKTIPIWCGVLNYLVFEEQEILFFTPPNAVSASEHDQIKKKIKEWGRLAIENGIDITLLKQKINKPLRPIWITPDAYLPDEIPEFTDFYPLVLCTASRMVQDGVEGHQGYTYVQGAADDHEEWAQLLTPELLWNNREELSDVKYNDSQLYEIIEGLSKDSTSGSSSDSISITQILPTNIYITSTSNILTFNDPPLKIFENYNVIIDVSETPILSDFTININTINYLSYPLPSGKKGSKELRMILPKIITSLEKDSLFKTKILIICNTGIDFSVGIALVISCLFYSPTNNLLNSKTTTFLDKTEIRKRLVHIITQYKSNPSRNTLNSVNSYLMS